ncbi:hypothetical protein [Pseudoxanthomonas sp. X-1]|uniref:hypothetical protein n=1 Tax=Pseudoxanthomonas sp. X-1 TaxID=2571115 RepID=UPI00110C0BEA|nr:hypothetical protein [Pseudoxanthomonas sp. X-1]TMN20019.1 hypothetical protein FF950_09505 [Pseudoxanthomonas sp. X-1]UAY76134.1 hypothetical protein LAJ50_07850 [Pseudoxanthomonas sp. X-1]
MAEQTDRARAHQPTAHAILELLELLASELRIAQAAEQPRCRPTSMARPARAMQRPRDKPS